MLTNDKFNILVIMSSLDITIPGYYIAIGKTGKEQIVKYFQEYLIMKINLDI
jgi:hypothetical protein